MFTLYSVLNTNMSQINVCHQLFRVTLNIRLPSTCLSLHWLLWLHKNESTFQKIHSLSGGGAHSRVEAYIASPTSPPYVGKQLTVLLHTVQHAYSVVPTIFQLKSNQITRSTGPQSSTRLSILNYVYNFRRPIWLHPWHFYHKHAIKLLLRCVTSKEIRNLARNADFWLNNYTLIPIISTIELHVTHSQN